MKITMYELLGMIKDGKVPKKIKFNNIYFYYRECKNEYVDYTNEPIIQWDYVVMNSLNDEVEIIEEKEICHKCGKYNAEYNQTYCEFCLGISKLEEEKKIPEKIEYYDDSIAWVIDDVGQLSDVDKVIIDTLNGVIDYLKSKGDE